MQDPNSLNTMKSDAFRVDILSLPGVVMFTQQISLPGLIMGEALVSNPNVDYSIPGENIDFENMSIDFIVSEDLSNYLQVWNWMIALGFPQHTDQFKRIRDNEQGGNPFSFREMSDIKISLQTNNYNPSVGLTLVNAWPISLSGLDMTYQDSSTNHPTANVEFQYQYHYFGNERSTF
jgi:hypothetical protein